MIRRVEEEDDDILPRLNALLALNNLIIINPLSCC